MASIFDPVVIGWDGEEYTIEKERVMGLIETIESVITQYELSMCLSDPRTINKSKISRAYAAALRYAGATHVTHEMVYAELFDNQQQFNDTVGIVSALLSMMFPSDAYEEGSKKKKLGLPNREKTNTQETEGSQSSPSPSKPPADPSSSEALV